MHLSPAGDMLAHYLKEDAKWIASQVMFSREANIEENHVANQAQREQEKAYLMRPYYMVRFRLCF